MGIPNETRSSEHLEKYARYHLAALKADPASEQLVARTAEVTGGLGAAFAKRQTAEMTELEANAVLTRKNFDIDEGSRGAELEVLARSGKDRGHADYRSCFPKGFSAFVALSGKAQADAVTGLVTALKARFSDVAERYGDSLTSLAGQVRAAETTLEQAELAVASARNEEYIARSQLVRQLHSNRGALRALYPRNRSRVASFFPPSYSRAAGDPDPVEDEAEAGETAS